MPEDKAKKYQAEMIAAIQKNNWMRWAHIDCKSLSFCKATAYNYKLEQLEAIRETFAQNRSRGVNYLLQKWINSDNPTLQIAAMRIISEDDDRQKLNQQYIDHTSKGESMTMTPKERDAEIERLKKKLLDADR
jgi:seryl-tRNA(Sec) selenium transferase